MEWSHPIFVSLCSGGVVGVITLITSRYVIRPKYCFDQRAAIEAEITKVVKEQKAEIEKEITELRITLEKHKEISHEVFARKDVFGPQISRMSREISYVRKRVDQLAMARKLPPIPDGPEDDGNGNNFT